MAAVGPRCRLAPVPAPTWAPRHGVGPGRQGAFAKEFEYNEGLVRLVSDASDLDTSRGEVYDEPRISSAVGNPQKLAALRRWARLRGTQKEVKRQIPSSAYPLTVRPSPPALTWFEYFALYGDWCVDARMFAERKAYLLSQLGTAQTAAHLRYNALLEIEREAEQERVRAHGFPTDGERSLVVAAVDRIAGLHPLHREQLSAAAARAHTKVTSLGRASRRRFCPDKVHLQAQRSPDWYLSPASSGGWASAISSALAQGFCVSPLITHHGR